MRRADMVSIQTPLDAKKQKKRYKVAVTLRASCHVCKLMVDSLSEENLPLTTELHLQPLFRKRDDLFTRDTVEIRILETRLHSLDDLSVSWPVHHALEVGGAARSRLSCAIAKRTTSTNRWC